MDRVQQSKRPASEKARIIRALRDPGAAARVRESHHVAKRDTIVAPGGAVMTYPRDLIGYGRNVPNARWPGGARIVVQFVLNYEEGGENSVLHGDAASEQFLAEVVGIPAFPARHLTVESIYEYGSRAGVWRILREFERRKLPLTVFGVSMALERNPDVTAAFKELGHEIACHGWRWILYQNFDEATEREHMRIGVEIIRRMTGATPLGWYTGRDSPNTRRYGRAHGFPMTPITTATICPSDRSGKERRHARSASRRPLHARLQRHALFGPAGLQQRRAVPRVSQGRLRRPVCRRAGATAHDVDRHALPAAGTSRALRRPAALP
jgi:peptidoglycan/xylan/chitin deacetylase (PgdA/CDA1 family)